MGGGLEFNLAFNLYTSPLLNILLYFHGTSFQWSGSQTPSKLQMFFDSTFIIFHCTEEIYLAHCSTSVNTQRQAVCMFLDIFTTKIVPNTSENIATSVNLSGHKVSSQSHYQMTFDGKVLEFLKKLKLQLRLSMDSKL